MVFRLTIWLRYNKVNLDTILKTTTILCTSTTNTHVLTYIHHMSIYIHTVIYRLVAVATIILSKQKRVAT